jgi:hypothetical protein
MNSFTSVFGASGGGADPTKLPLTGGTLTGGLTIDSGGSDSSVLTDTQLAFFQDENDSTMSLGLSQLSFGYAGFQSTTVASHQVELTNNTLKANLSSEGLKFTNTSDPENNVWTNLIPNSSNVGAINVSLPLGPGTLALETNDPTVNSSGTFTWSEVPSSNSLVLRRAATRTLQLGTNATSGTAPAHTIKGCNATAGQSGQAGGNLTISSGLSTGINSAASVIIATSGNTAANTVLNTAVTRLTANALGVAIGANGTAIPLLRHGVATLASGTVTVSDTNVVAGSRIFVNRQIDGGAPGDSYSIVITAGTGFTITSKNHQGGNSATVTSDTSTVSYMIINP